jgi:hypothetical protein
MKNYLIIGILKGIIILSCFAFSIFSQQNIINLDLSRYYFRIDALDGGVVEYDENEHCGMFPNGSYYMYTVSNIESSMLFGRVLLANGEESRGYQSKLGDGYLLEEPFGVKVISKFPPPKVMVDGVESNTVTDVIVDPTIKADKMYTIFKKHSPWMHIRFEGYQFVNQYYGDFTILRTTYKLTFDDDHFPEIEPDPDADTTQTIENFYILQTYRVGQTSYTGKAGLDPSGSWFIHHGGFWASTMEASSIVPGCDRNNLVITYGWDGDHPDVQTFLSGGGLFNDTGEPRWKPIADGNLVSTPYSGFTLLHCDNTPDDQSDRTVNNPFGSYVRINFTNYRGDAQWPGNRTTWNYFITPGPQTTYEVSTFEDGTDLNPTTIEGDQPGQVWGGWNLQKDDSVTIVHAIGSGSITREEARTFGMAWANWYDKGDVPEAYYNDRILGNVLATDEVKSQIVSRGKDSLRIALQRSQELWENNLDCPRPYPAPDLYVNSGPYSVNLEWDDVESKYGTEYPELGQVLSYRIYRKKGNLMDEYPTDSGKNLYWEMIADVPVSELVRNGIYFTYSDMGLTPGEDYHYAVTAVSNIPAGIDGTGPFLESSKWSNRSIIAVQPFVPGKSILDSIVVVPNPYYVQGQLMNFASDNNRLMFANLPPFCKLRIYNVAGDLIHTISHQSGSSVEFWDQITESNQYIASGVYVLVVTDAGKLMEDDQGQLTVRANLPGKAIIKFVIIR